MNGTKILLDTNIALYFLGGDTTLAAVIDQKEVYISVISEMEMLGYPNITQIETERIKAFSQTVILLNFLNRLKKRLLISESYITSNYLTQLSLHLP